MVENVAFEVEKTPVIQASSQMETLVAGGCR